MCHVLNILVAMPTFVQHALPSAYMALYKRSACIPASSIHASEHNLVKVVSETLLAYMCT